MRRLAVFASGSGTNFEAIVSACEQGVTGGEVVLMVCDKPGARVVERAAAHGVETFVFAPKEYASKADYEMLEKYALALFDRGSKMAAERGLILVDTKYEFGKKDGEIYLIDEIHTPDSSRYFYADGYEERFAKGEPQRQLSKEFVREWLMDHGFQGKPGQQVPQMTDQFVGSVSDRYIELYEKITGEQFVKDEAADITSRIENNVKNMLARLR